MVLGNGLHSLTQLSELYLSHNGIQDMDNAFSTMANSLTLLDLISNKLSNLNQLPAHMPELTDLWLSTNQIRSFNDIQVLTQYPKIDTVYLEFNPISKDFEYRMRLKKMLPTLVQIDADRC